MKSAQGSVIIDIQIIYSFSAPICRNPKYNVQERESIQLPVKRMSTPRTKFRFPRGQKHNVIDVYHIRVIAMFFIFNISYITNKLTQIYKYICNTITSSPWGGQAHPLWVSALYHKVIIRTIIRGIILRKIKITRRYYSSRQGQ